MNQALPTTPPPASPAQELVLLVGVCTLGMLVCVGAGWLTDGMESAKAAAWGMASAAAGGLVAWALLSLRRPAGGSVAAEPVVGLAIRLVVTGLGVGLAVLGIGFEKRPVLFAAMFGYLMLMATETFLLYRFASSDRGHGPQGGTTPGTEPDQTPGTTAGEPHDPPSDR